jgi:hypothetical protein
MVNRDAGKPKGRLEASALGSVCAEIGSFAATLGL